MVRGERPEVTAALADVLTTAATALRTFAGPPAPAPPSAAGATDDAGRRRRRRRRSSGSTSRDAPARPALAALGIDIGGTKVAGGVVAPDGTILATARRATPGASVADTEDAIVAVVEELAARHDGELVGVGVGAAGWFDRTGDTVLFSPHLAWRELHRCARTSPPGCSCPLWVGNDADAAAWAEYRYGAARGADLALMITLGTGIGGGIVLDGRLQRGSHGVAGEWGHMRVVPDGRLLRLRQPRLLGAVRQRHGARADRPRGRPHARRRRPARLLERVDGDPDRLTGEDVARAAAEGDPLALELVTEVGRLAGPGHRRPRRRPRPRGRGDRRRGEHARRDGAGARRATGWSGRCPGAGSGPARGWWPPSSARRPAWSAPPTWCAAPWQATARSLRVSLRPPGSRLVRSGRHLASRCRPWPTIGELAGQLLEEQADVGDDAHRLGAAAVGELGDRGRVDVHADQRDRRRQDVPGRDRVQHRRDHDREADAGQLGPHRPLALDHVGVDVGQRAVVAHRADQHERLVRPAPSRASRRR